MGTVGRMCRTNAPLVIARAPAFQRVFLHSKQAPTRLHCLPMSQPEMRTSQHLNSGTEQIGRVHSPVPMGPGDWHILFNAVTTRLQVIAGPLPPQPHSATAPVDDARLRAVLLECVEALAQLQATCPWPHLARERPDADSP